jgi:hypothetical protein
MNLPNISFETSVIIYPFMLLFGALTYFAFNLNKSYYENLIKYNYIPKKNYKSKYYILTIELKNYEEIFGKLHEFVIGQIILDIMFELNALCGYKYHNKMYFVMNKDHDHNQLMLNSDLVKKIFNNIIAHNNKIEPVLLISYNTVKTLSLFFKNLIYYNKYLLSKFISRRTKIPVNKKNINKFFNKLNNMTNINILDYPIYGQFYKLISDSKLVSFKLNAIKHNKMYEQIISSEFINEETLKSINAIDTYYIENDENHENDENDEN